MDYKGNLKKAEKKSRAQNVKGFYAILKGLKITLRTMDNL